MTRDEMLLAALARGDASTAALALSTGLSERTCRYGLVHLVKTGLVWSPARGRWRLTDTGRAIGVPLCDAVSSEPNTRDSSAAESSLAAFDGITELRRETDAPTPQPAAQPTANGPTPSHAQGGWTPPPWLGWALGAVAVGGLIALVYRAAPPAAAAPVAPPTPIPVGWPYNSWQPWQG